jgi:hypothetical protein
MTDVHPAYFQVRFRTDHPVPAWPPSFAIITAYATTGETWDAARNIAADTRLHAELIRRGHAPIRITGYDPETGHAEPGWAVALTLDDALDIGRAYLQDAIFWVEDGRVEVVSCIAPNRRGSLGSFAQRLDRMDTGGG